MSITVLTLWRSADELRHFLVPNDHAFQEGTFNICNLEGEIRTVDQEAILSFEVDTEAATAWAKAELGETLEELREAIDNKLAEWRRQLEEFKQTAVADRLARIRNGT